MKKIPNFSEADLQRLDRVASIRQMQANITKKQQAKESRSNRFQRKKLQAPRRRQDQPNLVSFSSKPNRGTLRRESAEQN